MMNKIVQNKKLMIVILSSVVLIIAAVSVLLILKNKNKLTATTMRLMEMQGTVTLESGGKIKEVIDNLKLNSGDILSTASESFVSISLDDYKMVKIQENSRAEFIQNGKELALNLVEGSLFFDVSKKLDADETFQISTSTMVVGIRGTSGYVFVEEDGADGILITDGVVDITGINPQTGETKKTTGKAGQVVHVYIIDDDDNTVQFDLENVKEEDLPPEVVEFLVEHPDLMDRVCEVTNWDKEKIIARYEALKAPQEPEQEDNKEEEKKPENEKEQDPPEAEELPPQDPPKQEDPPADPPGNTDDTVTDPAPIDPPAEEKQEETNNNDDSGDDDDDDEDDEDDTPILVSQLFMMSGEASVDVGSTISLSCGISPSNATNKTLSWSTSNASVATVSSSGVVTGVSAGSAIITATTCDGSGKSAGCMVSVDAPAEYYVQGVSISGPSQVNAGGSVNLTAVIDPSDAESGATISWSSSNESVATVSSTGTVTAVGLTGSTQITVTAQTPGHPVQSASKTVSVIGVPTVSNIDFTMTDSQLTSYTDVIQVTILFECENYVSGTMSYEIETTAGAPLAFSEQPALSQRSDGKWTAHFPVQLNNPSLSGVNERYWVTVRATLDGSTLGSDSFPVDVHVM